jgi:hypothetical protein
MRKTNTLPPPSPSNERAYELLETPSFEFHYEGALFHLELSQMQDSTDWELWAHELGNSQIVLTVSHRLYKGPRKRDSLPSIVLLRGRYLKH